MPDLPHQWTSLMACDLGDWRFSDSLNKGTFLIPKFDVTRSGRQDTSTFSKPVMSF
jgi:hypothetical protein